MNQDELIERCKLTSEELAKVTGCDVESIETMGDYEKKIAEAQLRKAIPLIGQEYEAECQKKIKELFEAMRDKWNYEIAHGHPVFSLRLDDWVGFLREYGLGGKDWWELTHYQSK